MKKIIIAFLLFYTTTSYSNYNIANWNHWIDSDGNCQNTRSEILIRDNIGYLQFKNNGFCNISFGEWECPYSGRKLTIASDVDIDHIVPLKEAYRSGGKNWSKKKKQLFANDPENLLVVYDQINRIKSDKSPDKWMPPLKSYRAIYLYKWITIKHKYNLNFSNKERKFLSLYNNRQQIYRFRYKDYDGIKKFCIVKLFQGNPLEKKRNILLVPGAKKSNYYLISQKTNINQIENNIFINWNFKNFKNELIIKYNGFSFEEMKSSMKNMNFYGK